MDEAMDQEFDTVAAWTADVALELGPEHYVVAGCRGSGGPAALGWLLDRLAVGPQDRMLDCGAGVGGPAAFAAGRTGARLVLAEPEPGACRAAQRLFGLPTVTAPGQDMPFDDDAFDVAWSLGVLCTSDDQLGVLQELHRVLVPGGRLGLLVYVRTTDDLDGGPQGNNFPTAQELDELLRSAGFTIDERAGLADLPDDDAAWTARSHEVDEAFERRFGGREEWRTAQEQATAFGRLLGEGRVRGALLVGRAR